MGKVGELLGATVLSWALELLGEKENIRDILLGQGGLPHRYKFSYESVSLTHNDKIDNIE